MSVNNRRPNRRQKYRKDPKPPESAYVDARHIVNAYWPLTRSEIVQKHAPGHRLINAAVARAGTDYVRKNPMGETVPYTAGTRPMEFLYKGDGVGLGPGDTVETEMKGYKIRAKVCGVQPPMTDPARYQPMVSLLVEDVEVTDAADADEWTPEKNMDVALETVQDDWTVVARKWPETRHNVVDTTPLDV